ncbi:proprotein convertase P-domain-containing protein [Leptolyngbya cf. ectocarpi LEGE 11479]|uniref:Proprotein convertase P-domain-containing protein n=1 Tax=Leptolyngbya cf. ectocarpi LEGE 11479 TaxID=1828722 RepID=A0A929A076_LEPEC|nr:proprotein convertase P-domain-containing protein [Leptolyngbya ectocarpi]MBE9070662.1 proprotein convertase P-domain-containing protein [Leptolyngbya cf. ectocarpi LEGE 11479]
MQAADNITVADIADNALSFAYGTGRIALEADANADGLGDVLMLDVQDTLQTNGRDLSISGIGLILGKIDTSVIEHEIINIDAGGPIPETGTAGTASFSFIVPDGTGNINDLNVRFSAEHTYDGDLEAVLTSPDGTSLVLFSRVGGGGDNFQDTILDDEFGWSAIDNNEYSAAPFNGRFHPQGTGGLAVFDGQSSEGTWTLRVTDLFLGDSGKLFQVGDNTAPWGTAQGTQLLLNLERDESGGTVNLIADANASVAEIITTGRGTGGEGGAVGIKAGGNIVVATVDTSTSNVIVSGDGGAITFSAGDSIDVNGLLSSTSISNEHEDLSPYSGPSQSGNGGSLSLSLLGVTLTLIAVFLVV